MAFLFHERTVWQWQLDEDKFGRKLPEEISGVSLVRVMNDMHCMQYVVPCEEADKSRSSEDLKKRARGLIVLHYLVKVRRMCFEPLKRDISPPGAMWWLFKGTMDK